MGQKYRIRTNIGEDNLIKVELQQNWELLEILSLKFTQEDIYTSTCADYGVVCGRISVNNGLGIPNARVSIFIPLDENDELDPVISALYPYKQVEDLNQDGYRYNLLPARKQHRGHEPTGTFPDQEDILTREEYLEVYEKYYKYTVKTNTSGDFMIWGVPVGNQLIHVDADLSDVGCFSLRPDDFIRQGFSKESFKNSYQFKASSDFASLPQIVSFDRTIDVSPFWGDVDICQIGIVRTDFDLSDLGVRVEPKAYLIGSVFSDQGNNSVNKNCQPRTKMGNKCDLISEKATIEAIRFTNKKDSNGRPILETVTIDGDVDESGSFVVNIPMNTDYIITNEFGENEITNDTNKGVATSGVYRFRISIKNESLGRVRTVASYLVPNIREYNTNDSEIDKSYSWSLKWEDYPIGALNNDILFKSIDGVYYPQDYFYHLDYNNVYTVSSFMGSFDSGTLGINNILPPIENDCESTVVTPPVNFGKLVRNFSSRLMPIVLNFERILVLAIITLIQIVIVPFQALSRIGVITFIVGDTFFDEKVIEPLQRQGTRKLGIVTYPECETCGDDDINFNSEENGDDLDNVYVTVGGGTAYPDTVVSNICGFADSDSEVTRIYLQFPNSISGCSLTGATPTGITVSELTSNQQRYILRVNNTPLYVNLLVFVETITDGANVNHDFYYFDDFNRITWVDGSPPLETFEYTIYDSFTPVLSEDNLVENISFSSCSNYMKVYNEDIVGGSYCTTGNTILYSNLSITDIENSTFCSSGKILSGQVIRKNDLNPCLTCGTHSGYSEFRNGVFTIVPAANISNWKSNTDAINEFYKRKLIGKSFCESNIDYSFIDNWLSGALYFFPFKSKVRWNNEEELDLDYRRTRYCDKLIYFKVGTIDNPDKRFYYRSSYFDGVSFDADIRNTLGKPTTLVNLGSRDEFINEVCINSSDDGTCSILRNLNSSSYQNFTEMLGLYINNKMDILNNNVDIFSFFSNNSFITRLGLNNVLNGDILQLISINNEVGIEEFDLQNRKYAVYNPRILNSETYPTLLNSDPLPINLQFEDINGLQTRLCINNPNYVASQKVPFFLWNKRGTGFGNGINQGWVYDTPQLQPLQGMEYNYSFTGDTTFKYVLFPMTKTYSGDTIDYDGINFNDNFADVETTVINEHLLYNNKEEGFSVLEITTGTLDSPISGVLWFRVGEIGNWAPLDWSINSDYIIKPTTTNYNGNLQILSTPFLFYFGLRPGNTAIDKFIERFGPKDAFKTIQQ